MHSHRCCWQQRVERMNRSDAISPAFLLKPRCVPPEAASPCPSLHTHQALHATRIHGRVHKVGRHQYFSHAALHSTACTVTTYPIFPVAPVRSQRHAGAAGRSAHEAGLHYHSGLFPQLLKVITKLLSTLPHTSGAAGGADGGAHEAGRRMKLPARSSTPILPNCPPHTHTFRRCWGRRWWCA